MFFTYEHIKDRENITTEEMSKWCEENLLTGESIVGGTVIFIETDIDGMAFKLKWL